MTCTDGMLFFPDADGTLTPDAVQDSAFADRFRPVDTLAWNPDVKVYWLRFSVKNETGFDNEWLLDFENWSLVDFYYISDGRWLLKKTGHLYPYRKRDYPVANKNYIRLPVKAGVETACLVRLESRYNNEKVPQDLHFAVAPRALWDADNALAGRIIFTFLGIFAVMFLYNLFLFLATRLRSYGYYLLVLFFAFYHTSYNSGYIISIFGGINAFPVWLTGFETVSSNLFIISVVLFVQEFLKTKQRYPLWNKILNVALLLFVVFGFLMLVQLDLGTALTGVTGLLSILAIIILGIKSVRDRYPSAGYFLIGYSAFLLSILAIIFIFVTNSLAKYPFAFYYALPTGTTVELVFFSFALANMINVLRRENEEKQGRIILQLQENQLLQTKVNRELEQKVQERTAEINAQKEQISQQKDAIEAEKEKADRLLLNILPESTANELKEKGFATPKQYQNVTVLFTDFVAFTRISEQLGPDKLVAELDYCFRAFDDIITKHRLEKIKTIGDAYMAAAGVPVPDANSARNVVNAALDIIAFMEKWQAQKTAEGESPWQLRLGIHTGPLTAGVVGKKKFAFDIWGDTVNLAAIMETRGAPGKINVSRATYEIVKDEYECNYRGMIEGKHKEQVEMYFLEGRKG